VSEREGGDMNHGLKGYLVEEEVYREKVSMHLQCVAHCGGESAGD